MPHFAKTKSTKLSFVDISDSDSPLMLCLIKPDKLLLIDDYILIMVEGLIYTLLV